MMVGILVNIRIQWDPLGEFHTLRSQNKELDKGTRTLVGTEAAS